MKALLLFILATNPLWSQQSQSVMIAQNIAAAASLSVIDGTRAIQLSGGGTTATAEHNLNLATHDKVWIYVWYVPSGGSCTTPTLTWSDTATNTFVLVTGSSKVLNVLAGSTCDAQFEIQDAIANSADSIVFTTSAANSVSIGFQAIQIRGTGNLAADTVNNYPGTASGSTTVLPSMTSTTAASIVVAGLHYSGSGVTATATASGCFSATGTFPANTDTSSTKWAALQYVILSSTASSTCSFSNSVSVAAMIQGAIYH